jgi:hypothetical protein
MSLAYRYAPPPAVIRVNNRICAMSRVMPSPVTTIHAPRHVLVANAATIQRRERLLMPLATTPVLPRRRRRSTLRYRAKHMLFATAATPPPPRYEMPPAFTTRRRDVQPLPAAVNATTPPRPSNVCRRHAGRYATHVQPRFTRHARDKHITHINTHTRGGRYRANNRSLINNEVRYGNTGFAVQTNGRNATDIELMSLTENSHVIVSNLML